MKTKSNKYVQTLGLLSCEVYVRDPGCDLDVKHLYSFMNFIICIQI